MGEALWIRRGTLARMACEIILNRGADSPPLPIARHLDLRVLEHCNFHLFYKYFCMRSSQGQHTPAELSPNRRGALNMHETRATATFAICH